MTVYHISRVKKITQNCIIELYLTYFLVTLEMFIQRKDSQIMKFTKKNLLISFIFVSAIVLYQWFKHQTIQWIELSNSLFLAALPLLIIGLFGFVLSKGTFDFFHYSMKRIARLRKRKQDSDEIEDNHSQDALSKSVGKSYQSVLTIGIILLALSILSLWDYLL